MAILVRVVLRILDVCACFSYHQEVRRGSLSWKWPLKMLKCNLQSAEMGWLPSGNAFKISSRDFRGSRGFPEILEFVVFRKGLFSNLWFPWFSWLPVWNLVAPQCATLRDYLGDIPLLRAMGFLVSQHGQLGAIPFSDWEPQRNSCGWFLSSFTLLERVLMFLIFLPWRPLPH